MRCGECQYWVEHDKHYPQLEPNPNVGQCMMFTSPGEGGVERDGEVTPRIPYTGYDGWTNTHRDFYCAAFKRVEHEKT